MLCGEQQRRPFDVVQVSSFHPTWKSHSNAASFFTETRPPLSTPNMDSLLVDNNPHDGANFSPGTALSQASFSQW